MKTIREITFMSYDLLFQKAIELHNNGRLDEAAAIYRQILETAPDNPDVLNLLGLVAQAKGVHIEAIELFYKAIRQTPQHAPLYFNLGISLDAWNKPIEAIDNFKKALELAPDMKEAWNSLATVYRRLGRTKEAQNTYRKALQLDSADIDARTGLALLLPDINEQIAELEKLTALYPQAPLPLFHLAGLYLGNARAAEALTLAQRALAEAPYSYEILNLAAFAAAELRQTAAAEDYFRRSLQIFASPAAAVGLASLLSAENRLEEAEPFFRRALQLDPDNLDAHINYADLLYKQHRLAEALEEYRAAVIINPKIAEVSNNLGIILKDLQEYEQALGLFFNALALKPDLEEISVNLAETLTLYARHNHEEAVKIADTWLKNTPDNLFARHTAAALKGENFADNKIFAEKLFDRFADNYELVLARLDYQLPNRIRDLIGDVKGTVADLGCGTGLAGLALKAPGTQLIGIDISEAMLEKAEEKNIYRKLIKADITDYLRQQEKPADLYIAADVFNYIGDLSEIISLIAPHPLCFSVECGENIKDFRLNDTGRYQHSASYINNLLNNNGYNQIECKPLVIRHEDNQAVNGLLYYAR